MDKKIKNILISTGPTRVYIDPVRYISNISSGKMGLAFIKASLARGYNVRAVSGCVNFEYPQDAKLEVTQVETNSEMLDALEKKFDWADMFISVAAIVDFEPVTFEQNKIKKKDDFFCLKLKASLDILKILSKKKRIDQIIVGFSLETENLIENANKKLIDKKLDFIIANKLNESMGLDTALVSIITKDGIIKKFFKREKAILANEILEYIIK